LRFTHRIERFAPQPHLAGRRAGQVAGLLLAAVLAPVAARAETLVVLGRPLELAPPQGFCRLSPEAPAETALAEALAAAAGPARHQVMAFADCDQLEAWRSGGAPAPARLGQIAGLLNDAGEPHTVDVTANHLHQMRKGMPRRSASEIAAVPGPVATLVEGQGYFITALNPGGGRPLSVEAVTVVAAMPLAIDLSLAPAAGTEAMGRQIAAAAGDLAEAVGETLAVNDVFDEIETVSTGTQSASMNLLPVVAGFLGLFSLAAFRSLWLLLRAPRSRI